MDYTIIGSGVTVYSKDTVVTQFGNIFSSGSSNTIYLSAYVAAAPTYGNNRIFGAGLYNLLNYMGNPGPVTVDLSKGVATNGYGGTDIFTGITGVQLSAFADKAFGSSASETFYLGGGNDVVYGGGGFDVVTFYSALSKDYQVNYDLAQDVWTITYGQDIKKLYQIDEVQFGDKVYVSTKPVTLKNGNALSFGGSWSPIDAVSSKVNGQLANTFHSLIKLDNSGYFGLINTGWGYSGFDTTQTIPSRVKMSLMSPNSSGELNLNTSKYISDPTTWGGGSVIVADFNSDGLSDIFLASHNESPAVAEPSTVYISNTSGTFTKLVLNDAVAAHDASLFYNNNIPMVVATTYAGNSDPVYKFKNGTFSVTDVDVQYQINTNTAEHYEGSATTIGKFSNNSLELIRGDTLSYSTSTTSNPWEKVTNSTFKVFTFSEPNNISQLPLQVIPAYLSTVPAYQNFESYLGKGITHITRVWSEDLNHDGALDLLAAESMWSDGSDVYPSAIQVLINKGDGTFVDKTTKLNPDIKLTTNEFDYTPSFVDIDRSGIDTLLFAGVYTPTQARQSNFVLLNDGTGRLHVALHDQFVDLTPTVYEFLNKQFAENSAYWVGAFTSTTPIPKYIGVPQPDGSLNFVAEVSIGYKLPNGLQQAQYQYVNVPLHYNLTTDFSENISITDRNNSTLLRTWAGNDSFNDFNANSLPAHIDGGIGIDTSNYSGTSRDYKIKSLGNSSYEVWLSSSATNFPRIDDTLVHIERLKFADSTIALDLDSNAGTTAKILGAVLGKDSIYNKSYVGIGLSLLDAGWSYDNLAGLALDAVGAKTNDQIVSLLWTNVIRTTPTAADKQPFIALLENGMTAGALAHLAADTPFNTTNINLVGLAQTGIEFIPIN